MALLYVLDAANVSVNKGAGVNFGSGPHHPRGGSLEQEPKQYRSPGFSPLNPQVKNATSTMSMSSMRDDKSNSKAKSYNFHYPNQRAKAKPIHNEPPDKRRRVDHNMPNAGQNAAKSGLGVQAGGTDDLWDDDDLDFMTQDQFENIDHEIALSQQVTTAPRSMIEDKSKSSLGRTVGRGMGRSHSANDVVQKSREMLQKKGSSSLSGAMQGGHQHNSKENECTKYRSPAYPSTATMGGVRSERYRTPAKSYTSKPCTGTGDMQQKVSAGGAVSTKSQLTPTAGTTCSGQFSPALPGGHARTDFPDIFKNKMAHLKEELELYKKEVGQTLVSTNWII